MFDFLILTLGDEWIFSWLTSIRYDSLLWHLSPIHLVWSRWDWPGFLGVKVQLPWDFPSLEEGWDVNGKLVFKFKFQEVTERWWDLLWVFSMIISHWAEKMCWHGWELYQLVSHTATTGVTLHHCIANCRQQQVLCKYYAKLLAAGWRHCGVAVEKSSVSRL